MSGSSPPSIVLFCEKSAPPTFLLRPAPPPGSLFFSAPRPRRPSAPANPVCHSVFGGRTLESRRYRFKYLCDDAHDRRAEVLSRFEVMEDHFIQIKTCANLAVHVNRSIIPAQRVLNLVVEICRSEKIAENFMEMLKSFEMIDGGNVHIFHSPWPRRRNRRG